MSELPDKDFKAANIKNKTKTQNDHLSTYLKLKKKLDCFSSERLHKNTTAKNGKDKHGTERKARETTNKQKQKKGKRQALTSATALI